MRKFNTEKTICNAFSELQDSWFCRLVTKGGRDKNISRILAAPSISFTVNSLTFLQWKINLNYQIDQNVRNLNVSHPGVSFIPLSLKALGDEDNAPLFLIKMIIERYFYLIWPWVELSVNLSLFWHFRHFHLSSIWFCLARNFRHWCKTVNTLQLTESLGV